MDYEKEIKSINSGLPNTVDEGRTQIDVMSKQILEMKDLLRKFIRDNEEASATLRGTISETNLANSAYDSARKSLESITAKIQELQKSIETKTNSEVLLNGNLASLQEKHRVLISEVTELTNRKEQIIKQKDAELSALVAKKNEEMKSLQATIEVLSGDILKLKEKIKSTDSEIQRKQTQLANLKNELLDTEESFTEKQKTLGLAISDIEKKIAYLGAQSSGLEKTISEKKVELTSSSNDLSDIKDKISEAKKEFEKYDSKRVELNIRAVAISNRESELNQKEEYIKKVYSDAGIPFPS